MSYTNDSSALPVRAENHGKFLGHLSDSKAAVAVVADWLRRSGLAYDIEELPLTAAKTHDDWKQHADSGDIKMSNRVEVKKLKVDFTGYKDWPFGNRFIVCAKHSFDRARPRPLVYVVLNRPMTVAGIVYSHDSRNWWVERKVDSRYSGVSQEFYMTRIARVRFESVATGQV